mmetsp:Transcript_101776/g.288216  ORF Transcript_101776/g.288216 Transcript_101776/m.288216 type:complete len:240 (-) Transcript_101776:91-810(-)
MPKLWALLFGVLGMAFTGALLWMLVEKPLVPPGWGDPGWLQSWLLFSTADYELSALCLCALALATEGPWPGILWCSGFVVFGAGVSSAYVAYRLAWHGTLQLAPAGEDGAAACAEYEDISPKTGMAMVAAALYSVAGMAFTGALGWMLASRGLYPLQLADLGWMRSWLLFSTADYELSALCLCGVFLATDGLLLGALWSLGTIVFGAGVPCAYVAARFLSGGAVALAAEPQCTYPDVGG